MATVTITDAATKQWQALPVDMQERVLAVVERLEKWPEVSGVKRLTGPWRSHARIRTGAYRVIFTIDEQKNEVVVVRIAHRSRAYD